MFNPARHYPLLQCDWDADVAQQTIASPEGSEAYRKGNDRPTPKQGAVTRSSLMRQQKVDLQPRLSRQVALGCDAIDSVSRAIGYVNRFGQRFIQCQSKVRFLNATVATAG